MTVSSSLPGESGAPRPALSIVVPVYYNEESLPETVPTLAAMARGIAGESFELIFVDDGSRDRSYEVLLSLQAAPQHRVRIVKLTRNFGSMAAIQAGLAASRGQMVGMISADLQDPPELFVDMAAKLREGAKCAFAVRADREEGFLKTRFANLYYSLLRRYALPGYPAGGFDFCLIDRQVVDELVRINEKNAHLMNLIFWLGYPSVWLSYTRRARKKGRSRWTLAKKLKLFADSFVAFSFAPIRAVSAAGFLLALLAVIYGAFQVYLRMSHGTPVQGFTTIVTLIALTSGIQMMMLGILGEYLWRTLDAARSRPQFVVERVIESPHA
ncbi:glycosyltransferase [Opitutaceae bacterium EW11]|nr:glycosyltransferase [Opitutaceae bacterium EW11]